MTNKNVLIQKIDDLAEEENQLWKAFEKAEKDSAIGMFALRKQLSISKSIFSLKTIMPSLHPVFLVLCILSATGAVFSTGILKTISWITYVPMLLLVFHSRERLVQEYNKSIVGPYSFKPKAFGISYVSLTIYKFFENKAKESGRIIDSDKIDKIIKIVKAVQECEAITYGYADALRKLVYGVIFTSPYYASYLSDKYLQDMSVRGGKFIHLVETNPVFDALLMILAACIALILYVILYGEKADLKRKKRYFIFLNLLKECYATK